MQKDDITADFCFLFRFDSGLSLAGSNLINFVYVPLDIFLNMPHNELTELEAWLYFLSSDNPLHVQQIITKYPLFQQLYRDIIHFRYAPKELIHMFSEALIAADRNTVRLMIDEMRQELTKKDTVLLEKDEQISGMSVALFEKDEQLSEKDAKLSEKEEQISGMSVALSEKDEQLFEKDAKLSEKDEQLSEKDAEIARLKELLARKQS